ncbi:hypothetical protein C8R44DRAFT_891867 [Mycena epipterygia]|nr:hypothetical protein C8R44DRAFT_891867 [Mycena epipterygia]
METGCCSAIPHSEFDHILFLPTLWRNSSQHALLILGSASRVASTCTSSFDLQILPARPSAWCYAGPCSGRCLSSRALQMGCSGQITVPAQTLHTPLLPPLNSSAYITRRPSHACYGWAAFRTPSIFVHSEYQPRSPMRVQRPAYLRTFQLSAHACCVDAPFYMHLRLTRTSSYYMMPVSTPRSR